MRRVGGYNLDIFDNQSERPYTADGEVNLAHLFVGCVGQTNPAWLCDALQSSGDVDAVAHQVAVALLNHVAEMDADAELDLASGR